MNTPKYPHITVQLTGINGNAHSIVQACRISFKNKLSHEEEELFQQEVFAGDYNHLLQTCQRWFNCI